MDNNDTPDYKLACEMHMKTIKTQQAIIAGYQAREQAKPSEAGSSIAERCCLHDSDCAVHNAPAFPVGPCDCSLYKDNSRAAAVPEGYVMVPAIPTIPMLDAGLAARKRPTATSLDIWLEMCAAAPKSSEMES